MKKQKSNNQQKILKISGFLFFLLFFIHSSFSQSTLPTAAKTNFSLGVKYGYDYPLFKLPFNELKYGGDRYIGAHADLKFPSRFGLRLDYANIKTNPKVQIPYQVYYGATPATTAQQTIKLMRNFVGIGPSYTVGSSRVSLLMSPMVGYTWLKGGDAEVESMNPSTTVKDVQLVNTGFNTGAISGKFDLDLNVELSNRIRFTLGTYYLRHFKVKLDDKLDISTPTAMGIVHGENVYDVLPNPYTISTTPPNIVKPDINKSYCKDLSSIGVNIGLAYTFGGYEQAEKPLCKTCGCPDDTHNVAVTVRDKLSNKVIPNADVALKNMQGEIVATGTTTNFGVVVFEKVAHGNYMIDGMVYGVPTTTNTVKEHEFVKEVRTIQKEILYTDVRFILKGKTINKGTRNPEPNVLVTLINEQSGDVKQDNSDAGGDFVFRLDGNSSYKIIGNKDNKLSDIERASTIGLIRSTTLFVDLELGMDDFDCGQGTVLDIKYPLDKAYLTASAKFELDRLVQYMKDHNESKIELSSHTDSRGSNAYNLRLSDRRAKSAAQYIISQGIPSYKIIARGYGESRLLNRCADGSNCSEAEHKINRRTEAKLICQ